MTSANPGNGHSESPTDHYIPSSLPAVHFAGTWTDDERAVVGRAIEHAEEGDASPSTVGKPWLCVSSYVPERDERFYFASRLKHRAVWRGRSAEELADDITRRSPSS